MDSITQAVLGAAIGQAMLGNKMQNKGFILGAIIATIPDLDVFLYFILDSYKMLSIHRGISHSILFSLIGALLIAYLLTKWKRAKVYSFKHLFIFSWLCLFTHTLLDAFTAYGTQLFLPFSNYRVGFDSINVIDPLYTMPLIIGLVLTLWKKKSKFNHFGLLISSCFLMFTLINKQYVKNELSSIFLSNNVEYNSLLTMPVGIANINWYGVAKSKDSLYLRKYSILNSNDFEINSFPINEKYLSEIDEDVAKTMRWFAKDFYTVEKVNGKIRIYNLQVDMRGVIKAENHLAPTVGYFEILLQDDNNVFSSGSVAK
jgi:inner membrane protein